MFRACGTWAKEGKLTQGVVATLQTYIGTEHSGAVWLLLGLISQYLPCRDVAQVLASFTASIAAPQEAGLYTLHQMLKVLLASVANLSRDERKGLQELLLRLLAKFLVPSDLISTACDVVTVVSSLDTKGEHLQQYQSAVDAWAVPILQTIDAHLSSTFLTSAERREDEELLGRQIFTLGVLAMVCPHRTHSRFFLMLQSVVFRAGVVEVPSVPALAPSLAPALATELPSSQAPPSSQPPALAFKASTKLQAVAIASLGKMCLQNEEQAKKIIPGFGRVLETTTDPAIKNNIMYALADMCVRYASLVDPLLPQMTSCLKDKSPAVRRTTLILLVHLLQEDYLKIRGNSKFFFRILHTLMDPSEEVRHLSKFYLEQRLLKRIPNIVYSNFPEAIFHFTGYRGHATYNKLVMTDQEREMFSLSGEARAADRARLYFFMLDAMTDEQRFQTTYRLCQDVLGGAVEGAVELGVASHALLQDTFLCLSSDHIKLHSLKTRQGEEEGDTEQEMAGKVMEAAKKKLISDTVKKNVIENIVPIVIALKHKLEAARSPLLQDLFKYLRKMMDDYKTEVADILSADRKLAAEVEFDMRRFEQEERERAELAAARVVLRAASPAAASRSSVGSRRSSVGGGKEAAAGEASPAAAAAREQANLRKQVLKNALSAGSAGSPRTPRRSLSAGSPRVVERSRGEGRRSSVPSTPRGGEEVENLQAQANSSLAEERGEERGAREGVAPGGDGAEEGAGTEPSPADGAAAAEHQEEAEKTGEDVTLIANANGVEKEQEATEGEKAAEKDSSDTDATDKTVAVEDAADKDAAEKGAGEEEAPDKRVSGQGMERQKENRTPRSRKFHNVRAISTPAHNKTVLAGNVTFMHESALELSCITVLSPPSAVGVEVTRRPAAAADRTDRTDAVSFRFRRGSKDMFEDLVDEGAAGQGRKRKRPEGEEGRRSSRASTSSSSTASGKARSDLGVISEERGGGSQEED